MIRLMFFTVLGVFLSGMSPFIVGGEISDKLSPEYLHSARFLIQARTDLENTPEDLQNKTLSWRCSGTIIGQRKVLTAAHCFPEYKILFSKVLQKYTKVRVRINAEIFFGLTSGEEIFGSHVTKFIKHPEYQEDWIENVNDPWNPEKNINDIAVAFIEEDIPKDKSAAEIIEQETTITEILLSGYGDDLNSTPFKKPILRRVTVPFIEKLNNDSEFFAGHGDILNPKEISSPAGGCQGDSGGSAYYNGKLVGVIIRGPDKNSGGCKAGITILTDLRYYKNWVLETCN